ncbi:hypothetical protein AWB81_00246 [Caballeronia arationis]|nr:hypothetical protein AWB81_00246 [Caballeronia arationis]
MLAHPGGCGIGALHHDRREKIAHLADLKVHARYFLQPCLERTHQLFARKRVQICIAPDQRRQRVMQPRLVVGRLDLLLPVVDSLTFPRAARLVFHLDDGAERDWLHTGRSPETVPLFFDHAVFILLAGRAPFDGGLEPCVGLPKARALMVHAAQHVQPLRFRHVGVHLCQDGARDFERDAGKRWYGVGQRAELIVHDRKRREP